MALIEVKSLKKECNNTSEEERLGAGAPNMTGKEPFILGIESSCDETACALVTRQGRIR